MNLSKPDPNDGQLVPLAHQEVRYRAAPTWTRALQWAIVGCIGFGFIYAVVARIDEVVIARGELPPPSGSTLGGVFLHARPQCALSPLESI